MLAGEPYPVVPQELCAVKGCGADGEHPAQLDVRLAGGYQYPPVRTALVLQLCFEHAAQTTNGLSVTGFTAPKLG